MLKRLSNALVALTLVATGVVIGTSPAQAVIDWTAKPKPSGIDQPAGQVPTPPKVDPLRDKQVPANPRSRIKGVVPPNPQMLALCPPTACYKYAGRARTSSNVTSVSTNASVAIPSLDAQDYHTLWEMTVQANDNAVGGLCNFIELGWNRDRALYGETYPNLTTRLFASVWYCDASGNPTFCGYNGGCGYTDYGPNPINLGSDISAQNQVNKNWQIVHSGGRWWIWYDTNWIGYWPDDLGHGQTFTSGTYLQTFDEIAAGHDPTCTDAGNSRLADKTQTFPLTGQSVTSFNEAVAGGPYALAAYTQTIETNAALWNVDEASAYSGYYGGPGASPNPGACP